MRLRALAVLILPALFLSAGGQRHRRSGTVHTAKEAKAIAERETGGHAVSAQPVPLNGASGGWEVDVHMPKEDKGWRCIVDDDTHQVFRKTRIENPPQSRRR